MKDIRVTDEDLKQFSYDEAMKAILEVQDLLDTELRRIRDSLLDELNDKISTLDTNYNSNFEAVNDLRNCRTVESLEEIFNVMKIGNFHLVRYDHDSDKFVELTKEWLMKVLTDVGCNKTKRDLFWKELQSYEFLNTSLSDIDVQLQDDKLSNEEGLTPPIEEVVDNLSSNEKTKLQLKQIFYSIIIGQRLEDKAFIISGHKTRKKFLLATIRALTKNRMIISSYKKLQKDSFNKLISRAIVLDAATTRNEIESLLESLESQIILIDESKFIGDTSNDLVIRLDRTPIDSVKSKIEALMTIDFYTKASAELNNSTEIKMNRYYRRLEDDDSRLQEFLKYLNEIALIGNESIPSTMLYAMYLDYCRYKKISSEFSTQSQFSKAISDSLLRYRYVLSDKTERIKAVIKSERLSARLVEELLETNLHFKDAYEENRSSKVFNLRFDSTESTIEDVESALYKVTDFKLRRQTDEFLNRSNELKIDAQMYSERIEKLVSSRVKESTFKTIELTRFLAYQTTRYSIEEIRDKISNIEKISRLPLTAELRIDLVKDLFTSADELDTIDRAFRYNELDKEMIELLSKRQDVKAKKLLKTFSSSVDRHKKQRVREAIINEICKNVRLI